MHELSIATGIIDAVLAEAAARGITAITAVHVSLGQWSGVDPDALRFSFDVASDGTLVETSPLVINIVPVAYACEACGNEHAPDGSQGITCLQCGGAMSLVRGRELQLTGFETMEEVSA
jgi:hydrogenase nickel incorporation protein HypA/HybF